MHAWCYLSAVAAGLLSVAGSVLLGAASFRTSHALTAGRTRLARRVPLAFNISDARWTGKVFDLPCSSIGAPRAVTA